MLMIPRRHQGVPGQASTPLGQLVKGSFEFLEALLFFPFSFAFVFLFDPLHSLHSRDEQSRLAARLEFGRDAPILADGSIEVGSAVAIDERHVYYTPEVAPLAV
jgi:hypothetical protein